MGFWHIVFGIYGGSDSGASATVYPVLIRFAVADEFVKTAPHTEQTRFCTAEEIVKQS